MTHQKFTSIESFAHTFRGQQLFDTPATVRYGAKIKLHGTNAAVRIDADGVTAQGRNRDIPVEDDQYGFSEWVAARYRDWFRAGIRISGPFGDASHVVFHGEWAGKGVQKTDAVTQLNERFFFVFALQIGDRMITDPAHIEEFVPEFDDVLVLPWHVEMPMPLNFGSSDECDSFAEMASEWVDEIGKVDPFIKDVFGIEGPGEGLVFMPLDETTRREYGLWTFKVKTKGHAVKSTKKRASKDMEIPAGIPEFVSMFVTPARLAQGLSEACNGEAIPQKTGDFLKWMGQDVKKESVVELEDAGLTWKDVSPHVTTAARDWFLKAANAIK